MSIRFNLAAEPALTIPASLRRLADNQYFDFTAGKWTGLPLTLPFAPPTTLMKEITYGQYEARYDATTDPTVFPDGQYLWTSHHARGISPASSVGVSLMSGGDDAGLIKPTVKVAISGASAS